MRCPYGICDGEGWVVDAAREASPCRCLPERNARLLADRLKGRIPKRYRDVSFQHTSIARIDARVLAIVRDYVEDLPTRLREGAGLWLTGGTGTGKTSLAMLISKEAMEQGHSVVVYSLPRLLSEIRRTYDADGGPSTLGLLDRLAAVELLHIDDVGAEKSSSWVLEQLYSVVNSRYEEGRSVTITTNLDPNDLREQVGERTVSRLEEMCRVVLIPDEEDHRRSTPSGLPRARAERADRPAASGAAPSWAAAPPTWGTDPGGEHRPVRRGRDEA